MEGENYELLVHSYEGTIEREINRARKSEVKVRRLRSGGGSGRWGGGQARGFVCVVCELFGGGTRFDLA